MVTIPPLTPQGRRGRRLPPLWSQKSCHPGLCITRVLTTQMVWYTSQLRFYHLRDPLVPDPSSRGLGLGRRKLSIGSALSGSVIIVVGFLTLGLSLPGVTCHHTPSWSSPDRSFVEFKRQPINLLLTLQRRFIRLNLNLESARYMLPIIKTRNERRTPGIQHTRSTSYQLQRCFFCRALIGRAPVYCVRSLKANFDRLKQ